MIDHNSRNQSASLAYIDNSTVSVVGQLTVSAGYAPPSTLPSTTISQFANGEPNSMASYLDALTIPFSINTQLVSLALGGSGADNFALGGSLTLSFIREEIHAYISNSTSVTVNGAVNVTALDNSSIGTLAGAVAASLKMGMGGSIGASIATADIANDLQSYIENSTVSSTTASVSVLTQEKAQETTLALSGDGGQKFALGGSIAVNVIDNGIDAHIAKSSTVTAQNSVLVSASDTAIIGTGVGQVSIAVGATSAAVGASVAVDVILNVTRAYIDTSTVTATTGNVQLLADSNLSSTAVAVGGDGSQTFSLGGSVVVNYIGDTTDAQVTDGSKVTAATGVTIQGQDTSSIGTGAGQVDIAIGTGQKAAGAVGAAIAVNVISTNVSAYVDNSTINSGGGVTVQAISNQNILGVAIGLGGASSNMSFSLSLVGSGVGNYLSGSTQALIQDNSSVTTTNNSNVVVQAVNSSTLKAGAGVVGFALVDSADNTSAAVGISAASNRIGSSGTAYVVLAAINNSTVNSAGGVSVIATANPSILAVTVAGSGSGATQGGLDLSGAGAGSGNTINLSDQALIEGASKVSSGNGQPIQLSAVGNASITADAAGLTLGYSGSTQNTSGSVTVGAALAVNSITNTVAASINGSTVTAPGDVDLTATTQKGLTFNPSTAVGGNTLTLNSNPGLQTGDAVIYSANGGSSLGGLTNGQTYYAIVTNNGSSSSPPTQWYVQLAANSDAAYTGTPIPLGSTSGITSNSLTYGGEKIFALTLGLAGSLSTSTGTTTFGVDGAGSGSGNQVDNTVQATIINSTVDNGMSNGSPLPTGGSVSLVAHDGTEITAAAGAAAITVAKGSGGGSGSGAIGVSVAINGMGTSSTPNTVTSAIEGSTVDAGQAVTVDAESTASILAVTVAGAGGGTNGSAGSGTFAGAGAGSQNEIFNTVQALINAGSTVTSNNGLAISITAYDNAGITADAGGLSLGYTGGTDVPSVTGSFGAAAAVNSITAVVTANINDSTVISAGDLDLTASTQDISDPTQPGETIFALTLGIAGALSSGGQGLGFGLDGAGTAPTTR